VGVWVKRYFASMAEAIKQLNQHIN